MPTDQEQQHVGMCLGIKFPGSHPDLPSRLCSGSAQPCFNSSSGGANAREPSLWGGWCLKTPNKKRLQSNADVNISKSLFSSFGFWESAVKTCALGWKLGKVCILATSSGKPLASDVSTWHTVGLQWRNHVGGLIQTAVLMDSFSDNSIRKVK